MGDFNDEWQNFCCHPNYQNYGAFYDWAMIQFKGAPQIKETTQYPNKFVPAKILVFIKEDEHPGGEVHVLVHACAFRQDEDLKGDSVLTEQWQLEYDEDPDNEGV